jgi:4-amino-4-deoxy-L-arabinose transferase-like glycosyltransferase
MAFFPFLGNMHLFDWDEINFAEAAREMIVTGNYSQVQINFEPFYEKPPLFFWLQVLSMKVWGINEFAARFPNAVFGVITILTLYLIGKNYKNSRFGLLWALMHLSALLPHFYFKTGIIDPVFNYFIFFSLYCLTRLIDNANVHAVHWALIGGMCAGLAILTKGPIGILLPGLTFFVYWIKVGCKRIISWHLLILFGLTSLLIPFFWFGYQTYKDGGIFIKAFVRYQIELFNQPVAGHGQPFYYHFILVFLGCFPASILALGSFNKPKFIGNCKLFPIMQILFWVVMVVFSLATTKIVHYSSMAYFPISFLAAHYLYNIDQKLTVPSQAMRSALISVGIFVAVLFIGLPLVAMYKEYLYNYITDEFMLASIKLAVPWCWMDCLVGISYLLLLVVAYYFFKKQAILYFVGWCAIATTTCLGLGTRLIVPKIEAHTQRTAIEFYKSLAGKSVYVTTVGFKSYAPLFYFKHPKENSLASNDNQWLLTGKLDKPAYFVIKINDKDQLKSYSGITFIKSQGGFAFYKRDVG